MISRRQIIESQQELNRRALLLGPREPVIFGLNKSGVSGEPVRGSRDLVGPEELEMRAWPGERQMRADRELALSQELGPFARSAYLRRAREHHEQPLTSSANQDEEEAGLSGLSRDKHDSEEADHQDLRHFDPYSVYGEEDEEEDVWYSEERLFEDHLQEIVDKWMAIDDEIWAKVICMERNRRIAKAYARKHSLTVNGSEDEYLDGTTLGLNSFDNPDRDAKTKHIKQYIGQGLRIKITENGDLIVRRFSKSNIFVHQVNDFSSLSGQNSGSELYGLNENDQEGTYGIIGGSPSQQFVNYKNQSGPEKHYRSNQNLSNKSVLDEIDSSCSSSGVASSLAGKSSNQSKSSASGNSVPAKRALQNSITLDLNKSVKIFDMTDFKAILAKESRRPNPNRKLLQTKCISVISFVLDDHRMLNLPSWIMIINIVAIDLLNTKLGLRGPHSGVSFGISRANLMSHGVDSRNSLASSRPYGESHHLAASKKAFANAAALGAYNGSHNEDQAIREPWPVGHKLQLAEKHHQEQSTDDGMDISNSAGTSDGEPGNDNDGSKLQKLKSEGSEGSNEPDNLQASSSSGFNSHCSSQNDSLVASSNSGPGRAALPAKKKNKPSSGNLEPRQSTESDLAKATSGLAAILRGQRPPKLPHRISPSVGKPVQAEKANLILVEPTGLSPPLPKRQGKLALREASAQAAQFNSVKLIDENGLCSVIKQSGGQRRRDNAGELLGKDRKLPAGIPAHAQLAPPATQRHILNYLMAATNRVAQTRARPMPSGYIQRPLPIVPGATGKPVQRFASKKPVHLSQRELTDETLYYCGLQARVPNRYRSAQQLCSQAPLATPLAVQNPVSSSAINAILNDLKQNSKQQPNHYHSPNLRHQFSLSDIINYDANDQQINLEQIGKTQQKPPNSLMKLFKSPAAARYMFSGTYKTIESNRNMFSSVDQINVRPAQKSYGFLGQIGFPLRSKNTKIKLKQ